MTMNVAKGYAFVRYETTEAAVAALHSLSPRPILQGASLAFKRRFRPAATAAAGNLPGEGCEKKDGHESEETPHGSACGQRLLLEECALTALTAPASEAVGGARQMREEVREDAILRLLTYADVC